MVAELLNQNISRLANSIAEETTYIQDWRAGVPDYRAPTITPESSFWEVTDSREQSPLGNHTLPHFCPVKLHGSGPDGPVSAVNRRLLAVLDRYDIYANKLHSFMQYRPVKFVIQTLLIELELVLGGPDSIEFDYDWIIRSVSSHVRQSNMISRQSQLGKFTPGGLDYTNRCLANCVLKLVALHEHAGFFWNLANGQVLIDIFLAVIEMFREAWASFQLQSGPRSVPEDWMHWSFTYDPWIAGDGFYTLDSRPVQDFYLPKNDSVTKKKKKKKKKTTPPWGRWNPTSAELAALVETSARDSDTRQLETPSEENFTEELWVFENILDSKWRGKGRSRKLWYLIKWKDSEVSWQPDRDLKGCCDQWVAAFHERHPKKAGPPKWLIAVA